jgi:hypothetical protein
MRRHLPTRELLPFCIFLLFSFVGFSQLTQQWAKRYNGPGNMLDQGKAIATDKQGNVYVTGTSGGDYLTIKYNGSGDTLWTKRYNGPGNGEDNVSGLAVDAQGYVYVTGGSQGKATGKDYATIKYDANGNELWAKRYNGPAGEDDGANALAIDASGNVYVTGESNGSGSGGDFATIKYNASGSLLWVKRYNGPNSEYDAANAVVVDASGNVYVTGRSTRIDEEAIPNTDFATLKYDTNGNELWATRWEDTYDDNPTALAVDASGNVYVTGSQGSSSYYVVIFDSGLEFVTRYVTIKYNSNGQELWARAFSDSKFNASPSAMAVDASGNVYVTGSSDNSDEEEGFLTGTDFATLKYDTDGNQLWVRKYPGNRRYYSGAASIALDASGNIYVTGSSDKSDETGTDFATLKYDTNGNALWVGRYPVSQNDMTRGLAVDGLGNVYITGFSFGFNSDDYLTIKYAQEPAAALVSYTLINADTNKDLFTLKDGDSLNLTTLPTLHLTIRANTHPAKVDSVVFGLSGAKSRTQIERIPPYALFGDSKVNSTTWGDYNAWTPSNGNYNLIATPYFKGKAGVPLAIRFTVLQHAVNSLSLINAETNQEIAPIKEGDVIDLSTLPTRQLNIRANTYPDKVGSVVFDLNEKLRVREDIFPYAIGGDINGDYRPWTLPLGKHTLTVIPYELKYADGKKGIAYSVRFTVVDPLATARTGANVLRSPTEEKQAELSATARVTATPNPFAGQTTLRFSVPRSGYTTLYIYDIKGARVQQLFAARAEEGQTYQVALDGTRLSTGVYMARLTTAGSIVNYQLLRVR